MVISILKNSKARQFCTVTFLPAILKRFLELGHLSAREKTNSQFLTENRMFPRLQIEENLPYIFLGRVRMPCFQSTSTDQSEREPRPFC